MTLPQEMPMLRMKRTTESPWVVLVEDDESLRGQLASALEQALPDVEVQRTPDADVALRLVHDSRSRLLITEAQTSSVDGLALATCARRQRPQLPLIFLADASLSPSSARVAGLSGSHLIDKPPHLDQFVGLVTRVLEPRSARAQPRAPQPPGFRGELSTRGMLELVQLVAMSTPTGALQLSGAEGAGTIWFEDGSVVHAASARDQGIDAFQRMLLWRSGQFSVDASARAPERTVTASTIELLLDAARLLDESSAGAWREGENGRAADHFERGLQAVWRKAYADALPEWERAAALEPSNRLYQHNLMRLRHLIHVDREQDLGEVSDEQQEQRRSD